MAPKKIFASERTINVVNIAINVLPKYNHLPLSDNMLLRSSYKSCYDNTVHLFTNIMQAGFLSAIGALVFFFLLMNTPDDNGKSMTTRVGYLLGFTFLTGVGLGPLLEHLILVEPSIINPTAFVAISTVFVSFSTASMLFEKGRWLYLGSTSMTMLTTLMVLSLANIFFGVMWIYQTQLYLGLLAMCGFVLYDTQMIIEKRRLGSRDCVAHSLDLFVDFIGIFTILLIILTQRKQESRKKRRD